MRNFIFRKLKAITKHLVIAFFFTTFSLFTISLLFQNKFSKIISYINQFAIFNQDYEKQEKDIKLDGVKKRLTSYPSYGEAFGSIEIPSVSINSVLYHGESLSILKYGTGHHGGSYFPGEGGTIIIAGHNSHAQFYNLPQVKVGDTVIIKTTYGTYTYEVDKTEIAEAKALGENLRISKEEETIMLYTCYPVGVPGFKTKRFVVYGHLVGEEYE